MRASLLLASLLSLLPAPARAQRMGIERPDRDPAPQAARTASAPPAPPPPGGWYGEAAVVADAIAVGTVTAGVASGKWGLLVPGYVTYLVGAPINHLAHGQGLSAAVSLALRAVPLVIAGGLIDDNRREHDVRGGDGSDRGRCGEACKALIASALIAPVVLSAIDDVCLARYPGGGCNDTPRVSTSWAPQVSPVVGGWMAGAAGRF